jgi:hypothetical protein
MTWQAAAGSGVDAAQAERAGTQAGTFLARAIHAEVDGARIDSVQILMNATASTHAVYGVTAVAGPLRNYVATAWGGAGRVASKEIVAHGTIEECRVVAQALIRERSTGHGSTRAYTLIGAWSDTEE